MSLNSRIRNYINHVVFVLDASGSMAGLTQKVIDVFDAEIKELADLSIKLDQETRISVYLFNSNVECIVYDKDVMRLPSIKNFYNPDGGTALIDASYTALTELQQTAQLHGDHAFLFYALTDGEENKSTTSKDTLKSKFDSLPDNYSFAILVPNQRAERYAASFGFPPNNIRTWDVGSAGLSNVGSTIRTVTNNFMNARAKGLRGSKNLFDLNVNNLSTATVATKLTPLNSNQYRVLDVGIIEQIRPFVENATGKPYQVGHCYYELTKTETIQPQKQLCVLDINKGLIYTGPNARTLLNLPNTSVKVAAKSHPNFKLFVQSTSVNRKLIPGTKLLVLN